MGREHEAGRWAGPVQAQETEANRRFDALAMEHGPALVELRAGGLAWPRIARVMNDRGVPGVLGEQWTEGTAKRAHDRFLALGNAERAQ